MQVYQAVIVSKLLYGLDTLQFTEAQGNKLDTFQLKGFRIILNVKTTYIEKNLSNGLGLNLLHLEVHALDYGSHLQASGVSRF